jgi:tetratricopeptide (TPR) repeat protein
MADPIFERYKEALRAGHVAALRGRLDDALVQYRAAAEIAPDRPLPHVGMADALLLLGRIDDALASSGLALQRAPGDPSVLEVAARVHEAAARHDEAAALLDRLADALVRADNLDAGYAAAVRARDLRPTDARKRRAGELAAARSAALGSLPAGPGPDRSAGWYVAQLATPAVPEAAEPGGLPGQPGDAGILPPGSASSGPEPAGHAGTAHRGSTAEGAGAVPAAAVEAGSLPPILEEAQAGTEASPVGAEPATAEPATAEPATEVPPAPPVPPDPEAAFAAADGRAAAGDAGGAAARYVEAAEACLSMGAVRSAVDECLRALAGAPGDTGVHLELARILVATGHAERAADTLGLLERLLTLDGDSDGLAKVEAFRRGATPPAALP